LLIKIKDIPDSGLAIAQPLGRALLADALEGMSADLSRSQAEARLELNKTEDDTVFLRGSVVGEVLVPCVRCLREVRAKVEAPLKMVLTEAEEAAPGEDSPADEGDDTEHATHDGITVDLGDVLREALILAVPMTPLCRATCKGLCPVCGGDRNEKDCSCEQKKLEDPRLAPLKDLKL
jgi:DUF177 domain-containing protein